MKIYAFSGLGADERVFDALNLKYDLVVLPWKSFSKDETMKSYALKMVEDLDLTIPYVFLGVSFGGMLVSELSTLKQSTHNIVISSVLNPSELPWMFRLKIPVYKLPTALFRLTRTWVCNWFGANDKRLIKNILKDTNPGFIKNAIRLVINWENKSRGEVVRIHGSRDRIIPKPDVEMIVVKGGHLVIVDQADEISKLINDTIKNG
tara:strand:- start:274 stop:891 length:618 start_codon:yes stop_codon:yes gene_type:complete